MNLPERHFRNVRDFSDRLVLFVDFYQWLCSFVKKLPRDWLTNPVPERLRLLGISFFDFKIYFFLPFLLFLRLLIRKT